MRRSNRCRRAWRRIREVPSALIVLLLVAACGGVILGVPNGKASATPKCPTGALNLGSNALIFAIQAALDDEPKSSEPMATAAMIAVYDRSPRSAQITRSCGSVALRKTVIVYFTRRALLPAESASQGVDFVSRFRNGYRVWQRAH